MPALTLLESAKLSSDVKRKGIIKLITERTPILHDMKWKTIKGTGFTYTQEAALPGIAFRRVGDTYPNSAHVVNKYTEPLAIMGGEVKIDNFQINTHGDEASVKATAYAAKARALAIAFSEKFFNGDAETNAAEFDGLKIRATGAQVVSGGTAALTHAKLDQAIDTLIGAGDGATCYINKTLRRKTTSLARDTGTGITLLDIGYDVLGKQVMEYNGVPLHIIERNDNEATILDFTETSSTASVWFVRHGEDYLLGLQGEGGSLEVKDFGELQASPQHMGRIEWYVGMAILNPRAIVRLSAITNA